MNIQTFEGTTMKEVVHAVRAKFGKDAVILSSEEEMRDSGKRLFKVTATNDPYQKRDEREAINDDWSLEIFKMLKGLERKVDSLSEPLATKQQLYTLDARLDDVRQVVFSKFHSEAMVGYNEAPEEVRAILQYLHAMEIDTGVLSKLSIYLGGIPDPKKTELAADDYYKSFAIRWMMKRLQVVPLFEKDNINKTYLMLGNSGSGKSSMILRFAAMLRKEMAAKPIVISYDRQRACASENTKSFCKLLGLDYKLISDCDELKRYVDKNADHHPIFIDTASHNPKSDENSNELVELKKQLPNVITNIVLSLTEKSSHLERVIKSLTKVGLDGVIFTKMDEVWSFGDIFNLSVKWGVGLTYFGRGGEIPGGFEKATRERVVERIFGLRG